MVPLWDTCYSVHCITAYIPSRLKKSCRKAFHGVRFVRLLTVICCSFFSSCPFALFLSSLRLFFIHIYMKNITTLWPFDPQICKTVRCVLVIRTTFQAKWAECSMTSRELRTLKRDDPPDNNFHQFGRFFRFSLISFSICRVFKKVCIQVSFRDFWLFDLQLCDLTAWSFPLHSRTCGANIWLDAQFSYLMKWSRESVNKNVMTFAY